MGGGSKGLLFKRAGTPTKDKATVGRVLKQNFVESGSPAIGGVGRSEKEGGGRKK